MRDRSIRETFLHLRALEVPITIQCPDAEVHDRLRICHAPCLAPAAAPNAAVRAEVVPVGDSYFDVRVDGHRSWRTRGLIDTVRRLNHELLHAVMRQAPKYFYVHAGVVALDGRAVILPGLSRAGKSTLVLALVAAGARFLSDEVLVFDAEAGLARAYPRAIKIRDECVDYFPEHREHFVGSGEARFLPFAALHPQAIQPAAVPVLVVAPAWEPTSPERLAPLSPGEALLGIAASALNFGTHRARSLDHLHSLSRGVDGYSLTWRNPRRAAAMILEGVAGARS